MLLEAKANEQALAGGGGDDHVGSDSVFVKSKKMMLIKGTRAQ